MNIVPLKSVSLTYSFFQTWRITNESRMMEKTIVTNISFHRLMKKKKNFEKLWNFSNTIIQTNTRKLLPFFYLTNANRRLRSRSSRFVLFPSFCLLLVVKCAKSPRDHVQPRNNYANFHLCFTVCHKRSATFASM